MLRKDYIIRLTEEFGKFIGVLFGLKNQNKWDELEKLINESAQKYTGVEIAVVERIPDEVLVDTLIKNHNLSIDNMKMLGDLLYEKGFFYSNGALVKEAQNVFYKALLLFRYVKINALDSDFSLDMHYKMSRLEQVLGLKNE